MGKKNPLSINELRRMEPPEEVRIHHKRKYPPHLQIRGSWIWPSKILRSDSDWTRTKEDRGTYIMYRHSEEYNQMREFLMMGEIDKALEIFSRHHPETTNWGIRFVNCGPFKTTRVIL